MASLSFKRVRVEVTELWSGEPISDSGLVQRMVEYHSSLDLPYPPVKAVDPTLGLWDIYLPEDAVREFSKRGGNGIPDRSCRALFLRPPPQGGLNPI